ncbi:hypothetical protein [Butyrivibrio sp. AE2005]|uniref:hypothetical protein n=1 Tax=Butyrivibrio sp. AE2005 TaxID=1496722 RepID=UPI00047ED913|nr:hypothetical protein [Butyrivibrio sp. AE2005]
MIGTFRKCVLKSAAVTLVSAVLFVTDISAKTGSTGTEYSSKGTITDEADINIDSSDIYTLDNAINANNKTLENYAVTAGDIYNNLSAIDSAVSKAKTNLAQSLEDMNIYVSRTDAGAVNSHAGTTDWVGTTTAAKSAAVANYTLEELIGQMKTSVTGAGSEMTAKINAGDFRSKRATSSIASGSQAINLAGATEINLDKNQQLVLPSGYYGNGITINNVISGETLNWNPSGIATLTINRAYTSGTISTENAYNAGRNQAVTKVASSLYSNNMFSQGGRSNININASKGNNEGIWARDEKNSSISDVIPLTLKDGNGVPYAILNNIIVTVGISSAAYYGGFNKPKIEASLNYSVTTNRGNTVISRSFSGSSTDTYNLFGITGLDGADSITFNSNAHVSVNMDGCNYGDRYVTATTTLSYVLQYISLKY